MSISAEEFERLVADAMQELEDAFPDAFMNVAVILEQRPRSAHRKAVRLTRRETLLGLYEGVPKTERSYEEAWSLPDRITLFIDPILDEAEATDIPIANVIKDVVWHEVAHALGHEERRARAIGRERGSTAR